MYISQLFPNFGKKEIEGAVERYEGLGTNMLLWVNVTCGFFFHIRRG